MVIPVLYSLGLSPSPTFSKISFSGFLKKCKKELILLSSLRVPKQHFGVCARMHLCIPLSPDLSRP